MFRTRFNRLMLACAVVLIFGCVEVAFAQPPTAQDPDPQDEPPRSPAPLQSATGEVGPEIYYMYDEMGNLRAVWPDALTFEEFRDRISEAKQIKPAEAAPSFVVQSLNAAGRVEQDRLETVFTIRIDNLAKSEDQFLRIPLRLGNGIIPDAESIKSQGPAEFFLENGSDGVTGFLRGGAGKSNEITLTVIFPLEQIGEERRVLMDLPRATASRVRITLPSKNAAVEYVGSGEMEFSHSNSTTDVSIRGAAGDCRLLWNAKSAGFENRKKVLEVAGLQVIEIEAAQVQVEADLTVQSVAAPFDQFKVQLPAASRLVPQEATGYTLVASPPEKKTKPNPMARQTVEVKLDEPTRGPVNVRLVARSVQDANNRNRIYDFSGFNVPDATRQSGYIAVLVRGDWQVRWLDDFSERFDVRRISDLPDSLPVDDVVAGFQYYSQPRSLRARIQTPTRSISVEPQYLLDISEKQALLTANFNYRVRGRNVEKLEIGLPGWKVEPVDLGPAELIDFDFVSQDETSGTLTIPLVRPLKGEFQVSVRARRDTSGEAPDLLLGLPQPQGDDVPTTTLVVLPADNVVLAQQLPPSPPPQSLSFGLPSRQQPPFYAVFERRESVPTEFECKVRVNPLEIKTDVVSRLEVTRSLIKVRQTFRYEIRNERIDSLVVDLPASLTTNSSLKILRDGQELPPSRITEEPNSDADDEDPDRSAEIVPKRLLLSRVIGPLELVFEFEVPLGQRLAPDASLAASVPLIMPPTDQLRSNFVELVSDGRLQAEPAEESWVEAETQPAESGNAPQVKQYSAVSATPVAKLLVRALDGPGAKSVLLGRAWLQTWFTETSRHDFVVFNFRGRDESVDIRLPAGVDPLLVEMKLNGNGMPPMKVGEDRLRVDLAGPESEHQLELRYEQLGGPVTGTTDVDFPAFVSGVRMGSEPLYWQVVLPDRQHLLEVPDYCMAAFDWSWRQFGWQRIPRLEDAELIRWASLPEPSASDVPLPMDLGASQANVYLMRLRLLPRKVPLQTASREVLTLASAGAVLALGFFFLYFPGFRQPGVAFACAVLLVAFGFVYPEVARIVAQLAVVGFLLLLLAGLLRLLLNLRHSARRTIVPQAGSSMRYRVTEILQPSAVVTAPVGSTLTSTSPPREPFPTAES